jgi:hypothetical protein
MKTDRSGRYQFRVATPDSTAQYGVGVRYAGVGYLSNAVGPGQLGSSNLGTITVFDTSATTPITLSQRHLLIQPPNPDGSVPVLELLIIRNASSRTRVPADSSTPTWRIRMPRGALGTELGESDVGHDAVEHGGDSIAIMGPITPGEKQLVATYVLPRKLREIVVPIEDSTGILGIMVADTLATATGASLKTFEVTPFENIPYRRFEASAVTDSAVVIHLSRRPLVAEDFWWVIVAATATVLAGTLVTRRRELANDTATP